MHILVFSSFLFLIPVLYGIYLSCYQHSILAFFCFLCSINYWRNPIHGWRRDIDIYVATFCLIHILYHIWYYIVPPISYVCFYLIAQSYILYQISCLLHAKNIQCWYIFHIFMHFLVSIVSVITLYDIYS